jgi:hypothetical protein
MNLEHATQVLVVALGLIITPGALAKSADQLFSLHLATQEQVPYDLVVDVDVHNCTTSVMCCKHSMVSALAGACVIDHDFQGLCVAPACPGGVYSKWRVCWMTSWSRDALTAADCEAVGTRLN